MSSPSTASDFAANPRTTSKVVPKPPRIGQPSRPRGSTTQTTRGSTRSCSAVLNGRRRPMGIVDRGA